VVNLSNKEEIRKNFDEYLNQKRVMRMLNISRITYIPTPSLNDSRLLEKLVSYNSFEGGKFSRSKKVCSLEPASNQSLRDIIDLPDFNNYYHYNSAKVSEVEFNKIITNYCKNYQN
jgi:hypothetical protein